MTVVNPKSISGINSITMASGSDNLLTIHTTNTTERVRVNSDGDVIVGSGITVSPDGDIFATGVTTTGSLVSSGAISGTTGTFTSHVSLGDSDQLRFGDSNDLVIQHNGTDSLISDTGTGDLYIRGSDDIFIQKGDGSETFIACNDDGSVDLYYNNDKKLATTSQGAAITNGSGIAALTVTGTGSNRSDVRILATGTADANLWLDASNGDLSGADYAVITHNNSTLDLEIISYANDVIIKTRNGTQGSGGLNNAIHCHENGAVDLYHDGTKQCETSSNGLAFPSGKGINFSATSDGSGTDSSELLDDYEEGTWVPVFTPQSGTAGSTSVNYANYTKVGRQVTVDCYIDKGSGQSGVSGTWFITGLPYTSISTTYSAVTIGYFNNLDNNVNFLTGTVQPNETKIIIRGTTGVASGTTNLVFGSYVQNSTSLIFTATYVTAS